jgi:hypothetical protein
MSFLMFFAAKTWLPPQLTQGQVLSLPSRFRAASYHQVIDDPDG